jgi:serine/threonine protein kinase
LPTRSRLLIPARFTSRPRLSPPGPQIDQLFRIFEKLGTPTPGAWPALTSLPDWCEKFPRFRPQPWARIAPRLCDAGRDLLERMLAYDPAKRISAADALAHPYFADVRVPGPAGAPGAGAPQ